MQKMSIQQSDFSRGELSSRFDGRSDLPFYYQGCSKLRNMVVLPQGGASRMPGTYFAGEVKTSSKKTRLIPFEPSTDEKYILEFGEGYIRFWQNHALVLSGGVPREIATSYTESDLQDLQWVVSDSTMYIFSRNFFIGKIEPDDTGFFIYKTSTPYIHTWNATYAYVRGDIVSHEGGWFIADRNNTGEEPGDVPSWQIKGNNQAAGFASLVSFPVGVYNPAIITPAKTYVLYYDATRDETGLWLACSAIPAATPPGTPYPPDLPRPKTPFWWWMQILVMEGEVTSLPYWSNAVNYTAGDYVYYKDAVYQATLNNVAIDPTADYRPSWKRESGVYISGRPGAGTFMDKRLLLAGDADSPKSIWGSCVGEYENHTMGANDADAFKFSVTTDKEALILWILAQDNLLVGTTEGEFMITGGGAPITPTNVQVLRQSSYGSAPVRALMVGDAVIFLQKGRRRVREFFYSEDKKGYQAPELTIFSDHITESGIIGWDYQQSPDPVVWAVRADGKIAALTYDRINKFFGWHLHETDGEYESAAVMSTDSDEDELWVIVRRTIGGVEKRYVEYFAPHRFSEIKDSHFVHCGIAVDNGEGAAITGATQANPVVLSIPGHDFIDGERVRITGILGMTDLNNRVFTVDAADPAGISLMNEAGTLNVDGSSYEAYISGGIAERVTKTVSGLDHLEGKSVAIQAGGTAYNPKTVASGEIQLDRWENTVHVGLPYTSILKTMRMGRGEMKRISRLRLLFQNTVGCKIGPDENTLHEIFWREIGEDISEPPRLFTGYKEELFPGTYDKDGYVTLVQNLPLPFTILSIAPEGKGYEVD